MSRYSVPGAPRHAAQSASPGPATQKIALCQVDLPPTCIAGMTGEVNHLMLPGTTETGFFSRAFLGILSSVCQDYPRRGVRLPFNGVWTCDDGGQLPEADSRRLRRRPLAHRHPQ